MSLLGRLFGRKPTRDPAPTSPSEGKTTGQAEHKGFTIRAVPFKEAGQFQTAGVIEKIVDGTLRQYHFIRADRSTMVEEVTELALAKGRLMIDEQGETLFG